MTSSRPGFPFRVFALAFIVSIVSALIGDVLSWQIHQRANRLMEKHIILTKNVGHIMLLDEALTMSARMAVATGDMRYEQRYDQLEPQLTSAIDRVRALQPQEETTNFVGETDAANTALVKMERQAFALAHQGKAQEATDLLASAEYLKLKNNYADGMRKTVEAVGALIESDSRNENLVSLLSVAASVSSVLILVLTWLLAARSARSWMRERERAERLERQFESIVESTNDAVISKTLNGIITSWNPGAEKLFGYTAEEAVGNPMLMLIPDDRQHEERKILAHIARGERVEHFESVRRRKDGQLVDIAATISPILDGDGKVAGASKIARDISERKRQENLINEHYALLTRQKTELEATLARVRRLEGMLSICMQCKKIRTGNNDWHQLEQYIGENSDAVFSHGLCPDCLRKAMKKLD